MTRAALQRYGLRLIAARNKPILMALRQRRPWIARTPEPAGVGQSIVLKEQLAQSTKEWYRQADSQFVDTGRGDSPGQRKEMM